MSLQGPPYLLWRISNGAVVLTAEAEGTDGGLVRLTVTSQPGGFRVTRLCTGEGDAHLQAMRAKWGFVALGFC